MGLEKYLYICIISGIVYGPQANENFMTGIRKRVTIGFLSIIVLLFFFRIGFAVRAKQYE